MDATGNRIIEATALESLFLFFFNLGRQRKVIRWTELSSEILTVCVLTYYPPSRKKKKKRKKERKKNTHPESSLGNRWSLTHPQVSDDGAAEWLQLNSMHRF